MSTVDWFRVYTNERGLPMVPGRQPQLYVDGQLIELPGVRSVEVRYATTDLTTIRVEFLARRFEQVVVEPPPQDEQGG